MIDLGVVGIVVVDGGYDPGTRFVFSGAIVDVETKADTVAGSDAGEEVDAGTAAGPDANGDAGGRGRGAQPCPPTD